MIGSTISHYTILEKLGEGGMGVVYKAQDTKLDRFVALKFLPPHLAASEQDKARFIQEAKSAAALNHPNVCSIIDIQEHDAQMFIVMEFVDGHTLMEKKSSLTQKQAIDYGIQIAEGLAAAHEKGIVHRDIKPENIMIRKDGIVQVMDFGLAKLVGVSRLTKAGSTVGTLGYMSPEQVQGQETDHRSDIFSFGVLLYEMVTGKSPFTGAHESAILYEIVNVDVSPPSAVKPEIDPELDRIVMECMEKDPNERMQSIKQVAIDLNRFKRTSSRTRMSQSFASRPAMSGTIQSSAAAPRRDIKKYIPWIVSGILLIVLFVMIIISPRVNDEIQFSVTSSIILPDSIKPIFFGGGSPPLLSPDGKHFAFLDASNAQILVYSLETGKIIRLPKTEGALHPFWSPDGKNIAFFANFKLKRTDLTGGAPLTICVVQNSRGGSWNTDNEIIFTPNYQAPIFVVSANGGEPKAITVRDSSRNEGSHRWPFFLPDGKHFLYLARTVSETGEAEGDAIYAGSVDGSTKKMILRASSNAMFANGHLIFIQDRTLMAQQFDPDNLTLEGEPFVLEKNVIDDISLAMYSVSTNGILLTQSGTLSTGAPIRLYSVNGTLVQTLGGADEQQSPQFSPDGNKLAVWLYELKSRKSNIWVYDRRTGGKTRLLNSRDGEFRPVWSPDGSKILFWSIGKRGIFETAANRMSDATVMFPSNDFLQTQDWSRDGNYVLLRKVNVGLNNSDIVVLDYKAKKDLTPVINSQFDEIDARFSPDGKWISYLSNESGDYELYITSFGKESGGQSWKLSERGASNPRWGATSNDLYYIDASGNVIHVSLSFRRDGSVSATSKKIFAAPLTVTDMDISRDGKYFAFTSAFETQQLPPVSMRMLWYNLNKEKVSIE
ncbi:MAG: protein kinase [Ignavibacteriales bacterium]|nr:protein kinase [Ignavibacteriales bacterium]